MKRTREADDTVISPIDGCQYRLFIEQDEDPVNPRKDFDNAGTMVCFHNRYNLGDETPKLSPDEYLADLVGMDYDYSYDWWQSRGGIDAFRRAVENKLERDYIILTLYLYDHSGLSMSCAAFSCSWDSGEIGFVYISRKNALEEWGSGSKRLTKAIREKARKCLISEVEEYDQYLTGDIHRIIIDRIYPDAEGNFDDDAESEEVDSWSGCFGHDYARQEGLYMLKYCANGNSAVDNARSMSSKPYLQAEAWGQLPLLTL